MSSRADRFDAIYREHYRAIYAYVYRRLSAELGETADVVAEVFTVAWRRVDDLPVDGHELLWLYRVAQRCVLAAERQTRRRGRLLGRLTGEVKVRSATSATSAELVDVRDAISRLRGQDREVLLLVLWDGLTHAEAATVLDCSVNAVAQRLHTARQRLAAEITPGSAIAEATIRK